MKNLYDFKVGDIIKVHQKIIEGKKERVAAFKGLVVRIKGKDLNKMFTVRQKLEGIDVEKIYPYYLPTITKVEVVERPKKKIKRANIITTSKSK